MLSFAAEGWDGRLLFLMLLTRRLQLQGWPPPAATCFSSVQ